MTRNDASNLIFLGLELSIRRRCDAEKQCGCKASQICQSQTQYDKHAVKRKIRLSASRCCCAGIIYSFPICSWLRDTLQERGRYECSQEDLIDDELPPLILAHNKTTHSELPLL